MKYWTGYITAAIIGAITWALMRLAEKFSTLVDMVYPYISRMIMGYLADWSSGVDFCLWQMAVIAFVVLVIASIVLMIIMKWNPVRWLGWVLTAVSIVYLLNTLIFGLNYYAGDLAADIRMEEKDWTVSDLADATTYYRDRANELATRVSRDENGDADYAEFAALAGEAGDGFRSLVYDTGYAVFAGSTTPVKELGWSDMYTSMGITGFTMGLTGEAAVNPNAPDVSLPFSMCHEMAHRMSIAIEGDANFAAFLACTANKDVQYQYSGYFMAFRYCYNALVSAGTNEAAAAAAEIAAGACPELIYDMNSYSTFYSSKRNDSATKLADTINDTYLKTSGDSSGTDSYNEVCDLLYSWYYQEIVAPTLVEEVIPFDPFDETQVDLSDNANAKEAN